MDFEHYITYLPLASVLVILVATITFIYVEKGFLSVGRKHVITRLILSFKGNNPTNLGGENGGDKNLPH